MRLRRIVGNRVMLGILLERIRGPASYAWYPALRNELKGRRALEIGGPSPIFSKGGAVPIYPWLRSWDDADYSASTLWTKSGAFSSEVPANQGSGGTRFLLEATELTTIGSELYDLVLSSHVLEHLANPLRALHEWRRVLVVGGLLLVVVPEGARTFDHARPSTSLDHILQDYRDQVSERDLTHLPEILQMHDLVLDPGAPDWEAFVERSRGNPENRALHHHVFTPDSLRAVLTAAGFSVELVTRVAPAHVLALGRKSSGHDRQQEAASVAPPPAPKFDQEPRG
jgi:SAM-dependent methyltransferase